MYNVHIVKSRHSFSYIQILITLSVTLFEALQIKTGDKKPSIPPLGLLSTSCAWRGGYDPPPSIPLLATLL